MRMVALLASIYTPAILSALVISQQLVGSLNYNITLSALNTTLVNVNSTGVPLVLGQNGATAGATLYVTSTYASYPSLALVNHALHAFTTSGEWFTNATAQLSGRRLAWLASKYYKPFAAEDYSAVHVPAHRFPLLAAHGTHALWSLCSADGPKGQVNVVFNVSGEAARLEFDPARCYGVVLHMIRRE